MAVSVVNMIPQSLSNETFQDSEPNLAVNPANPLQIAGTAFTVDPAGGANAPIFVSTDGGNTWSLNLILPGVRVLRRDVRHHAPLRGQRPPVPRVPPPAEHRPPPRRHENG